METRMKYDVMVQKGKRLMITSWDRTNETVTGPYYTLESFSVLQKFTEFLKEFDSPYKDYVDKFGTKIELTEFISYHHEEFTQWLVDNLYLDVEPKYILRLNYRMQMEYTEDDSI